MATYKVTDPISGKTLRLTGDSPPTEEELTQIFSSVGKDAPTPKPQPVSNNYNTPEWAGKYPNLYGVLGAAKEVSRFGAESAALVGGGMAGLAVGGPVGAMAGAGLAYGGVKAAERFLEGEKATIPQAIAKSAKDVATGSAMELGGQIIGRGVSAITNKIINPTKINVSKEEIAERIKLADSFGIELSQAEATGSKGLALYESMLDKSPFSTSIINTARELKQLRPLVALREKLINSGGKAEQVEVLGEKIKANVNQFLSQYKIAKESNLNALRDNVLTKLGSTESFESLGKTTQDALSAKSKAVYEKAGELYTKVGEMIPQGVNISTNNLQSVADRLLKEEAKNPRAMQNPRIQSLLKELSGADDAMEKEITSYPEAVQQQIRAKLQSSNGYDWKTIQSMRSKLNSYIAESDAAIKTAQPNAKFQSSPEAGAYKQLRKALDRDIEEFASQNGGEVKQAFDVANAFYKEGKLTYNSQTIRRIINANPERVVDMVFRPKGGFEIDAVRKSVGNEVFNKTMKPAIVKRLLGEGTFSPKELSDKLKTYGDEVLSKAFNSDEIKAIKDLATDGRLRMERDFAGHPFLKTIANERPEVVVDSIIGTLEKFPGSKAVLKNTLLIKSIVPKETFMSLQREMSDRLFRLNQLTDQVQPERLAKTIQTYDRAINAFYTPEQVKWLHDIAKIGKLMSSAEKQAANPSGTAQNVITWGTWGAILKSPISGVASGILAPQAMARIYLSPAGRKYFMDGLKTPLRSGKSAELFTKLMGIGGMQLSRQADIDPNNQSIE